MVNKRHVNISRSDGLFFVYENERYYGIFGVVSKDNFDTVDGEFDELMKRHTGDTTY